MILINLLPHREEKRRQRKRAFFGGLGLAAVGGLAVVAVWYTALQQMTAAQASRNEFLQGQVARLDAQIKDIATLRADIEALKARQRAVEDLQTDRNTPVYLLNELVRQTPEGVYLTSIRQTGDTVAVSGVAQTNERVSETDRNTPVYLLNELVRQTPEGVYLTSIRQTGDTVAVSGVAQTNERVSEFLRNTLYNSPWLERPELVEIKAATAGPNARDTSRLFDFSMRVSIKRPPAPAPAASGPAPAARTS